MKYIKYTLYENFTFCIPGGQTKSPKLKASQMLNARPKLTAKVYGLGENTFSVYNHKHFRLICQTEPGNHC